MDMRGEATCTISAAPERVYGLVSDITRMGEWSPECVGCEWMDGHDGPSVGAQFHGHNRNNGNEWTTPNTIVVADAGREFAWVVGTPEFEVCRWRFQFAPDGNGTRVTESFELGDVEVGFAQAVANASEEERAAMIEARRLQLIDGMNHTLEKLKAAAEGE
jgi:uncharacterized protein YndB with AHSA1/START domain